MKYAITVIFLSLTFYTVSQVSYDAIPLPAVSSTLYFQYDNLAEELPYDREYNNRGWNFMSLQSPIVYQLRMRSIDESPYGAVFADADYYISDLEGREYYYRKRANNDELLGEIILFKKESQIYPIVCQYTRPLAVSWQGLSNLPRVIDQGEWTITLDQSILEAMEIDGTKQLRINGKIRIDLSLMAEGTLYLPTRVDDVQMIEMNRFTEYNVEELIDEEWVEGDLFYVNKIPVDLRLAGKEIAYYAPASNEILSLLKMGYKGRVMGAWYISTEEMSEKSSKVTGDQQFILYPSMTHGDVRLDFLSFPKGIYRLEIYSIINKKVWEKEYYTGERQSFKEDLSFLPKGTYIYALSDSQKNRILTRRLAIIKS